MTAASEQDRSSALLTTLTSSLLSSFLSTEVYIASSKAICSKALLKIASLSRRGYLLGSTVNAQLLAELISAYATKITTVTAIGRRLTSVNTYDVATAAAYLVQGVKLGMASGEVPVSLVTSNIQVEITSSLITNTGYLALSTPANPSQLAYGSIQPKITLGPNGFQACGFSGGYAQLSLLQWSVNPYANSTRVKSQVLRFTSAAQPATIAATNNGNELIRSQVRRKSASFSLPGIPAYHVTLQFSSLQNFNFTTIQNKKTAEIRELYNFTLPACTAYTGAAYVPCKGCNISSYTNYNVTYSCYDITQLCPSSGSRRYLRREEHDSTEAMVIDDEDDSESDGDVQRKGHEDDDGGQGRSLLGDDDSTATPASSISYGVLIKSVEAEFSNVLSSNPFTSNLAQSTIILTFMGCLSGIIVLMVFFFTRVDYDERLQKVYVRRGADKEARKLLENEILKGGNGDLGVAYQGHVKSMDRRYSANRRFSSLLSRTLSRSASSPLTGKGANANFLGVDFQFSAVHENYESEGEESKKYCSKSQEGSKEDDSAADSDYGYDKKEEDYAVGKRSKDKEKVHVTAAVVTEFLHKLFPGRAIFSKKRNALGIICIHHNYIAMFVGSPLTQTRTMRFLDLVSLVLTSLFADTVFFGVFYPSDATCISYKDKVSSFILHAIHVLSWNHLLFLIYLYVYSPTPI